MSIFTLRKIPQCPSRLSINYMSSSDPIIAAFTQIFYARVCHPSSSRMLQKIIKTPYWKNNAKSGIRKYYIHNQEIYTTKQTTRLKCHGVHLQHHSTEKAARIRGCSGNDNQGRTVRATHHEKPRVQSRYSV